MQADQAAPTVGEVVEDVKANGDVELAGDGGEGEDQALQPIDRADKIAGEGGGEGGDADDPERRHEHEADDPTRSLAKTLAMRGQASSRRRPAATQSSSSSCGCGNWCASTLKPTVTSPA